VLLDGAGINDEPTEVVVLAVVGRIGYGEGGSKGAQRVIRSRSSILERYVEQVELLP
jgi:hypothetical protein